MDVIILREDGTLTLILLVRMVIPPYHLTLRSIKKISLSPLLTSAKYFALLSASPAHLQSHRSEPCGAAVLVVSVFYNPPTHRIAIPIIHPKNLKARENSPITSVKARDRHLNLCEILSSLPIGH